MGVPGFHPDVLSPSIGRIITSRMVSACTSSNARNRPLGCHEPGCCSLLLVVRRSAWPEPSASCQYKFGIDFGSPRSDANVMRRPSGVHTGFASNAGSDVTRYEWRTSRFVHPDVAGFGRPFSNGESHSPTVGRERRCKPVRERGTQRCCMSLAIDEIERSSSAQTPAWKIDECAAVGN